jgi:hypothetical protein
MCRTVRIPGLPSLEKTIRSTATLPGHGPDIVFEHGRDATLLPKIPGGSLYVENGVFDLGAEVGVRLAIGGLRTNIKYEGQVATCSVEEGIQIVGEAPPFGSADMWLNLADGEPDGTDIDYGIRLRAASPLEAPALMVISAFMRGRVSGFASQYRENVLAAIPDSYTAAESIEPL